MPKWLDTHGNSVLSIAICDRCKMKRAYVELSPDPNYPGLRVCEQGCKDQFDPYRLPARQPEKISLRFPRPDVDIAATHDALITGPYGNSPISPESPTPATPIDGNLDNLSP